MKKVLFIMLLLLPILASAQTLKGVIVDASTQSPLAGATILTPDGKGVATNKNGEFEISCVQTITVSHIGYNTVNQSVIDCNKPITVSLIDSENYLQTVEITSLSNTTRTMIEQPMSIAKLDKLDIDRGTGLFLDDAINANVPGVQMNRRAVSSGQQINIRGYGNGVGFRGASNNFDGQGTKIYLNGIPLTDAEGITVLDDIDFASLGNVEVVKGPAGSLYGLAIAGAVNLQTVKPIANQTSIGQKVMFGEYGLARFTTTVATATENASVLVNYGHQQADGYMDHTASNKDFVNFVGDFRLSEKQSFNTYVGYSNSYDERGGELTIDQWNAKDYTGNARYIKNNAHSAVTSFRAGISHSYKFSRQIANNTTLLGSAASTNSSSAGGWNDNNPLNYGFRSTFDTKFNLGDKFKLSGITGAELQEQQSHPMSYSMVTDSNNINGDNIIGAPRSNQVSNSFTYSYFSEWTLKMPMGFSVLCGIGISNMSIILNDRTYSANDTEHRYYRANYNNLVSPHVAVNKVFKSTISAYASYSKGYKAPVSGNIVIGATGQLNSGLVPEEGDQFEIGSKGALLNKRLTYQVALFNSIFSNKMTSVAVPLDSVTTAYTYITNAGGQNNQGLELLLRYTAFESSTALLKSLRPWANFTYNNFTYDDFYYESVPRGETQAVRALYTGNAVAGVPPIVANIGVDVDTKFGLYGNVNFNYRDAMPITSDGAFMADAYSLLNAKIGYEKTILKNLDLNVYAGANNLTSTQYYYMVFVNQLEDAYLPAPDRANFFGGINLKYIF
ncbi:MAG: TonB-dependent receptor [Salibacteraceae bacterium]|nr:TonB-dependent receptor [Salibacteraceae bacterium]